MADASSIDEYDVRFREDEELEFFTELALHETERWIQAVTKKEFAHTDDFRKSLENGVLLCELVNSLNPGAIRRINRLPTPIAGLDNINVFLRACKTCFGLRDVHLFDPSDLEDLSQRAIGESDRLKEEYEKRLRNVAVTVYWLGCYASQNYQGPQLDQSAFAAIVHRSHHSDNLHGFNQPDSSSASWDWTHTEPGKPRTSSGYQHARDGSLDSFGKDSTGSLDAQSYPTNMSNSSNHTDDPVSGSASQASRHRRYSSTDSLEGSINSGHSRQGSDSNDSSYPTRRLSTQMLRRQSTGGNPLQFIKGKPSTELAQLAETQMKVAAESKKVALSSVSLLEEDDPSDWQANLSTWKSRRKSQSERSYQMKEELEQMEREKEGGTNNAPPPTTKTYSQIQEERERRKSTGRHFYPIHDDDDDEDDIFSSTKSNNEKNKAADEVLTMTHKPRAEIAPWARDEDEEEKKDEKEEKKETSESEDEEINNNKEIENSFKKDSNFTSPSSHLKSDHFDSKESKSEGNDIRVNESFKASISLQQHSARPPTSSSQDILSRNENIKSMGPRTQSKIGSIMNKFQESQSMTSAPKQGYNERIDLKSRMKSFENSSRDSPSTTSSSSGNQRWTQQKPVDNSNNNFHNYRNNFEQNEESPSPFSHSVRERSRSSSSYSKNNNAENQVEKTVKISQKPNDDKGFGFILTGGADQDKPLCVSKVALGSGADLSELKMNDEIVSINQNDVTDKTSIEVGDIVAKAVSKGYIELKVHRNASQDDFSDEEFTSSSDEGEEELAERSKKMSISDERSAPVEQPQQESETEVSEEIQAVHMNRGQSLPTVQTYITRTADNEEHREDEDEEDGGPPAILRKWQRQRQRNEYAFEQGPTIDSQSPVYKKISLNAPIPRSKNEDEEESMKPRWQPSKPWDQRQEEWTKQQDQKRESDDKELWDSKPDTQFMFENRQKEMQRQYEQSLEVAEQRVEEKNRQEESFLQPEIDKVRILKERREQRQMRIQESAAAASTTPSSSLLPSSSGSLPPPSATSLSYQTPPTSQPLPSSNASHVSTVMFNVKDNITPASFSIPRQGGNDVIVIDPRNRSVPIQGTPVEFQVQVATKPTEDPRIKMAQEQKESQRLQELEEEKMRKIREKERQLQEQEDLLRKEREKLQSEQEEFKQHQQQLQQQQQAYHHQQQQQQQFYPPPPPQELEYPHPKQQCQQSHSRYPDNAPLVPSSFPYSQPHPNSSSISPIQPAMSTSVVSSAPYYSNPLSNPGQLPPSKPSWLPQNQREQSMGYNHRPFNSVNNSSFAPVQPQFNTTSNSSIRRSPLDDFGGRDRSDAPRGGKFSQEAVLAINRKPLQEPLASRVNQVENQSSLPKPAQIKITNEPAISQNQNYMLNSAPKAKLRDDSEWKDSYRYQAQEPTRGLANREHNAPPPRRPGYGSAQDHWLVQEAERRRVSGQTQGPRGPHSYSGPIKPQPDINNRWRDGPDNNSNSESMPHAIRQTLLQKTAGARGSDGSAHEGDFLPPPHHPIQPSRHSPNSVSPGSGSGNIYPSPADQPMRKMHSYSPNDPSNKYNVNPIHQIQQPPPPTLNRVPPQGYHPSPAPMGRENGLPVNGSQLCSHCNQELGFGAAMVIESLGIFFHLQCFRCCVCHASLGTGAQGADVRVRMNKLHCQNCYSNDEAGLKFSKV